MPAARRCSSNRHSARHNGFTLIELLVVVAIISLLVGLLVPAVSRSRAVGYQILCQSNQRQVAVGLTRYFGDERDHIPGTATSGWEFTHGGWFARRSEEAARLSSTRNDLPMSGDDWMSPVLGPELNLHPNRSRRLLQLLNTEFKCAANNFTYTQDGIYRIFRDDQLDESEYPDPDSLYIASYSSSIYMQHAQSKDDGERIGLRRFVDGGTRGGDPYSDYSGGLYVGDMISDDDKVVDLSTSRHRYKVTTVGNPSEKSFIYDGARYLKRDQGAPFFTFRADFETGNLLYGGNFSNRSPVINVGFPNNGNPFHLTEYSQDTRRGRLDEIARRAVYRHPRASIAIVFLDGSSRVFNEQEARKMHYYMPRGTTVRSVEGVGDPHVQVGDVIQ